MHSGHHPFLQKAMWRFKTMAHGLSYHVGRTSKLVFVCLSALRSCRRHNRETEGTSGALAALRHRLSPASIKRKQQFFSRSVRGVISSHIRHFFLLPPLSSPKRARNPSSLDIISSTVCPSMTLLIFTVVWDEKQKLQGTRVLSTRGKKWGMLRCRYALHYSVLASHYLCIAAEKPAGAEVW